MDRPAWRRLESKVVMVTGASSGIGHEICLDLAAAGCRVVAAARWIDRLRSLCDEIDGPGSPLLPPSSSFSARSTARSVAVELDVSAGGSVIEAAVQRAWDAFGRIDASINNAGVRVRMLKGTVINISSTSGLNHGKLPGAAIAYAVSKEGVNAFTKIQQLYQSSAL
ncbi:hypothetical protein BHM03_00001924 [Ensete ventricosum]|nr:hypothetical protein BHM03_00001924 [Ensete ventricosum]